MSRDALREEGSRDDLLTALEMEWDKVEALENDLTNATLLILRLTRNREDEFAIQARNWLRRKGLTSSPLREEES